MSREGITVNAWLAFIQFCGPALLLMLVLGIAISVLQTATQLRDSSFPFIVKAVSLGILVSFAGSFMLSGVEHYADRLLLAIPEIIHG
ncbi:flagellar biosynthetic protein FliQ [Acidisoma sp. C75]